MTATLRCDSADEMIESVSKYEKLGYEIHYQSRYSAIASKGEDTIKIYVSEEEE